MPLFYKLKETDPINNLCIDVRIILNCILRKHGVRLWTEFIWLKIEVLVDCCE